MRIVGIVLVRVRRVVRVIGKERKFGRKIGIVRGRGSLIGVIELVGVGMSIMRKVRNGCGFLGRIDMKREWRGCMIGNLWNFE